MECTSAGKKRHNFYRDDVLSVRYLPKFKWYHLKEHVYYNRQVRKKRLQQQVRGSVHAHGLRGVLLS